jgi:hypothetical protein
MRHKRTEIFIETTRVVEIHRPHKELARCEQCGAVTEWATVEEAALLVCLRVRLLFRWTEDGLLHTRESREGLLLICLGSLLSLAAMHP